MKLSKFQKWMRQTLTDIFNAAFDPEICNYTLDELAYAAKLHPSTVYKLHVGITKEPRMHTVFKLCRAVKMDISIVKEELANIKE